MSYIMRRFQVTSGSGGAGTYFADQINQFLLLNPGITPVSLTITWRYGRSRSDQFYLNLVYRGGSVPVRSWCIQFQSTATLTAEAQATTFFANNPTYAPVCTQVVSRPGIVTTSRRLLIIYATMDYLQPQCIRQEVAAAPQTGLAVGSIGSMYDTLDLARPAIPVLNIGNDTWPAGAAGLAVSRIGNSPDLCAFGGISPGCYTGGGISPPAPLLPTLLCGHCFPPEFLTVSTSSTTSTTSTSTSTTTNTGTTTTSTTTTSTSTTSTTTTTLSTTSTTSTTTTSTSTTSTLTTTPPPTPCTVCALNQPSMLITGGSGGGCSGDHVPGEKAFLGYSNQTTQCVWTWFISNTQGGFSIIYFASGPNAGKYFFSSGCHFIDVSSSVRCCPSGLITGTISFSDYCFGCGPATFAFNGGGSC